MYSRSVFNITMITTTIYKSWYSFDGKKKIFSAEKKENTWREGRKGKKGRKGRVITDEETRMRLYANKFLFFFSSLLSVLRYLVSQKKLSFDNFQHYQDYLEWRFFCYENKRQRTISEQILKTFGQCQNCQNLTFE